MQGPRVLLPETLKSRLYGRFGTGKGGGVWSQNKAGETSVTIQTVEVEFLLQIVGAPGFCHVDLSRLANCTLMVNTIQFCSRIPAGWRAAFSLFVASDCH